MFKRIIPVLFFCAFLQFSANAQIMLPTYQGSFYNKAKLYSVNPSNALNFDGSNDYVDCGNNIKFQLSSGTIEGWIKTGGAGGSYCALFGKAIAYCFYLKDNVLLMYDWNGGGDKSTGVNLADNNWHHIAMTFNSGVTNGTLIYIDGVLVLTTTFTNNNQGYPFTIGSTGSFGQNALVNIDDVRIWNVIRTASEIQSNMNKELSGSETGLVAYYTFNQGVAAGDNSSISTITDKTANAINGTLNNFNKVGATSNFVVGKVTNSVLADGLILNLDAAVSASYSGSGTAWNDISGNGNNATLNGAVFTNVNGVSYFNFSSTYVNTIITKSASMTFSLWAKTSDPTSCMLFNAGNVWNGSAGGPDLFFYNGSLYWNTWDSGSNPFGFSAANINSNWHNYTIVNDATSNTKLYFDGVLVGTATYKSPTYTTNLYIGGAGVGDSWFWKGGIANFQAYNRALTSTEISQNYNALKSRFN